MRAIRKHRVYPDDSDDPDQGKEPDKLTGKWNQNTNFGQQK
jgi:hypothetical protein